MEYGGSGGKSTVVLRNNFFRLVGRLVSLALVGWGTNDTCRIHLQSPADSDDRREEPA